MKNLESCMVMGSTGMLGRAIMGRAKDHFGTVVGVAIALVVFQEVIYVLALHALAFWIFPRLKAPIPEPPPVTRTVRPLRSV